MAAVFGDRSVISDAFITAWRFPNLFRRLLGEGALGLAADGRFHCRQFDLC